MYGMCVWYVRGVCVCGVCVWPVVWCPRSIHQACEFLLWVTPGGVLVTVDLPEEKGLEVVAFANLCGVNSPTGDFARPT